MLSTLVGHASMTIGAPHIAFRDLRLDRSPGKSARYYSRNVAELFTSDVIELQDDGVAFTAVDARMRLQVLDYERAMQSDALRLILSDPPHLPVVILPMTLRLLCR